MISIFTIPKPFRGEIATIQRNAIQSWMRLSPSIEIMLMGDDAGTREIAVEFGLKHIPDIDYNEYGTPLINDVFSKAQALATNRLVCYVNTDIILMKGFITAAESISRQFERFLGIGQRWDLEVSTSIDFSTGDKWEAELLGLVDANGQLHSETGIDYFLFPKGVYEGIPPFAVGRTAWDCWLVYKARHMHVPVINLTKSVTAVHQNHDYSHHTDGLKGVWHGPEAQKNWVLAGGRAYFFTIGDANWFLSKEGRLKRNFSMRFMRRQWNVFPIISPCSQWKNPVARLLWRLLIIANRGVLLFIAPVRRYISIRQIKKGRSL